jgi:hypothetical protein
VADYSTLPALAKAIAKWLPELGGRAFAVSEAEVTKENMPTLPLAMVALAKETSTHSARSNKDPLIAEDILVQLWMKAERYKRADNTESPFWAHYDYDRLRDVLLKNALVWKSPRGSRLSYKGMDIESDHLAVTLTFKFEHEFIWCADEIADDVCDVGKMTFSIIPHDGVSDECRCATDCETSATTTCST